MRNIPSYISERLTQNIQTRANKSDPSASLWVGRPTTVMTSDDFLERQTALYSSAEEVSIAVCHPRVGRENSKIYLAYINDGTLRVAYAAHKIKMVDHRWFDTGFSEPATAASIVFDGTMPKNTSGRIEFVTEEVPWVFWVDGGVLYGSKLGGESIVLAESNCTDVSAVRAMWSESGGYDFGLVVFFILDGVIYYRQLIGGEWMDAEAVSFGPSGVVWSEISAFRTWDYRVGIQCKSSTGAVYELFTQFMGVAKQNAEHVEIRRIDVRDKFEAINYNRSKGRDEHIEMSIDASSKMVYGLSSVPLDVFNIDDGTGNYGRLIRVQMDYPVSNVVGSHYNFTLVDSNSVAYLCEAASVDSSGMVLQLTFSDFNLAEGVELTLTYTPGEIQSPATSLKGFELKFMGVNLEAPDIPVPEPVAAWNIDSEGTEIAVQFSQKLVGDISGIQTPVGYVRRPFDLSKATITTLNQYSSSYPGSKVVDGDTSTYWRGTSSTNWVQFELEVPKAVTGMRMYLGSYYVTSFSLSGSNDGSTWTKLGGNRSAANSTAGKWYEYTVDNSTEYKYYRIDTLGGYSSSRLYIYEVEFQEDVPAGNELRTQLSGFSYSYVPGGKLEPVSRAITKVVPDNEDTTIVYLSLAPGMSNNLQNLHGDVKISYAGGTLRGQGGPVADFEFTFTPVELAEKNNPNATEHIEVPLIEVKARLSQVFYTETNTQEHVDLTLAVEAALTHVDDL